MPPTAVAKQYQHPPASGGHYDLSVVADYWPGVDPVPPPAPPSDPCAPIRYQLTALQAEHDRYRATVLQQIQFIKAAVTPLEAWEPISARGILATIDAARGLLT